MFTAKFIKNIFLEAEGLRAIIVRFRIYNNNGMGYL
jgi:hypothetical protein